MKKLLVCLLVAVMVFSMVACDNTAAPSDASDNEGTTSNGASGDSDTSGDVDTDTSDTGEEVELTFWAHQEPGWNSSYEEIAEAFTAENPNIKIKFEFFPYDEFESKIQTSLIAKSGGADLYELWGGWAIDFAPTGALAAMPDEMADGIRSDSYPSTTGALEHDGKLYGMPMEFNIECGGLFVNLKLLEQNELTLPTTWDEMIEGAKKATVIDGNDYAVRGFDFVNWDSVTFILTSMILSNGGQYLNEDGSFNFTSDEAKEAFTALSNLVLEDKVTDMYGLTDQGDLEGYQMLFSDMALYVPRGPWPMSEGIEVFELTYDTDFTYAPLPWYGDQPAFAAETGWSLVVNGSSEKQAAAFKFLDYFYNDEVLLQHNINCSMIPPKKSVASNPELVEQMPYAEVLVNILDDSQYIGYFNTDIFKEMINNVFVDYCSGLYASVDEALADLEETLNAELS